MNDRSFWIGVCLGIPLLIALFMKDDDLDASKRRTTDKCDEGE